MFWNQDFDVQLTSPPHENYIYATGPVLFLLYINHVVSELTCNVKIFADDIKIYLGYSLTSGDEASLHMESEH